MTIVNVVGARPNFMKMAPLCAAMQARGMKQMLVHTGQHYDAKMSRVFFDELGLPRPDIDLGVGSGTHAIQTGEVMIRFDKVIERTQPKAVVVVGDVNSTIACALTAVKRHIPVAHVEAGLRSFDNSMPEEINRLLTDRISDFLFTHSPEAFDNLRSEGIAKERIHFVGNIMIDTLLRHLEAAEARDVLGPLGLLPQGYGVVTLHRPGNVDDGQTLAKLVDALIVISQKLPLVFPVHPRTRSRFAEFNLNARIEAADSLRLVDPMGYLDFLALTKNSRMVITDSGGLQEETTVTGVPCLTVRDNTERPVTISVGTNILVGVDAERLKKEANAILSGAAKRGRVPDLWDGQSAGRIADILRAALGD